LCDCRAFQTNLENQRLAYIAAKKAYDLTSNQAGYIPNFTSRFNDRSGFGGLGGFPGFQMSGSRNSAFAGSAVGPDFSHQVASLNPKNPVSYKSLSSITVSLKNIYSST
jgi:hypothetical protein